MTSVAPMSIDEGKGKKKLKDYLELKGSNGDDEDAKETEDGQEADDGQEAEECMGEEDDGKDERTPILEENKWGKYCHDACL